MNFWPCAMWIVVPWKDNSFAGGWKASQRFAFSNSSGAPQLRSNLQYWYQQCIWIRLIKYPISMLSIHTGFVPISHTYRTSVLLHLAHLLQIFGPTAENMCPNIWLTSYKYLAQKLKIQAEIIPAMCKNLHSCCHICTQKQTVNLYLSSANPGAFWHTNSGKMVMVMVMMIVMVIVIVIVILMVMVMVMVMVMGF